MRMHCALLLLLPLLAACASSRPKQLKGAEFYYDQGMQALDKKRCLEAVEHLQRLVNNFPGSRLVPDAQYYLGEAYFCAEDYPNAVFEYQRLVDTYPSSQWVDQAQFKIGEAYFAQIRRPELDQKETEQALEYFRNFLEDYPDSPLAETARQRIDFCRNRLAHKQYLSARLYHRQGYLEAAELTYQEVLRNYSDTPWYYQTLYRLGEIAHARQDWDGARSRWEEVLRDSEDAELKKEARQKLDALVVSQGS